MHNSDYLPDDGASQPSTGVEVPHQSEEIMEGLPLVRPFSVAPDGCDGVPHEYDFWIVSDPSQGSTSVANTTYEPNPGTDLPPFCIKLQNLF